MCHNPANHITGVALRKGFYCYITYLEDFLGIEIHQQEHCVKLKKNAIMSKKDRQARLSEKTCCVELRDTGQSFSPENGWKSASPSLT